MCTQVDMSCIDIDIGILKKGVLHANNQAKLEQTMGATGGGKGGGRGGGCRS